MRSKRMPRWPLVPIALPAAVAIWSGWVGLGQLCGFGPVHVLPGINDGVTINTAICLPIGMEAYAAYALAVWLRPVPVPDDAREFAKWSAGGALALGFFGQVAFHVLTSLGWARAPVWVTVAVSCIPVAVVGLAAALTHLMSRDQEATPEAAPGMAPVGVPAAVPVGAVVKPKLPPAREVRDTHNCGPTTEQKIRAALRARDAQWLRALEPYQAAKDVPAGAAAGDGDTAAPAGALSLNGHRHG